MAVAQSTNTSTRRLFYGANVAIQIALMVALVVWAIYAGQSFGKEVDLSRSGINSLSPRTTGLINGLKEDITITAFYGIVTEFDENERRRQNTVRDMLKLYDSAGGARVTANLIDPLKDRVLASDVLKRLRAKPVYADEAKKHVEALTAFGELSPRITDLAQAKVNAAQQLLSANPDLEASILSNVSQGLSGFVEEAGKAMRSLEELQAQEVPRYGESIRLVRTYVTNVRDYFQSISNWVSRNVNEGSSLPADARTFMTELSTVCTEMTPELDELIEQMQGLDRIELETLSDQIDRWATAPSILVETGKKAVLVPFEETWPFPPQPIPGAEGDGREFRGEQAVSSAILKLTQTERTAVVFTRFGGESPIVPDFSRMQSMNMRQMPRAPYGVLNDFLGKENFVTHDWDLKTQKEPPTIEDAVRKIFVVFPPTPPQQVDPRQPPPEPGITDAEVQTILNAVDESGMAIFLASWSPPMTANPMNPGTGYQYADYLKKTWGIDVRSDYVALPFMPSLQDSDKHTVTQMTVRLMIGSPTIGFEPHAITDPLEALPTGFPHTCPLRIVESEDMPEGVTVTPLVEVRASDDAWAINSIPQLEEDLRGGGTFRREADIAAPFPIAAVATKGSGNEMKRVVVFGSMGFVANPILEAAGLTQVGGALQLVQAYPANPDLFINTLHWLTDEADRVSVGARSTSLPRLTGLKDDGMYKFWKVFLVAIWPGLALVSGAGVWLLRRR